MKKDPIVAELHKIREEHARRFNYDLDAMFEDLRRKQVRRKNVADLKPISPAVPCVAEPHAAYGTDGAKKAPKTAR
jgi:hypothetical protein